MAPSIGRDGRIVPLKVRTLKETCVVTYEVMTSQMASLLGTFAAFSLPFYLLVLIVAVQTALVSNNTAARVALVTTFVLLIVPSILFGAIVPRALAHITACHFLGQKTSVKETLTVSVRVVLRVLATMAATFVVVLGWMTLIVLVTSLILVVVAAQALQQLAQTSQQQGGGSSPGLALGNGEVPQALFGLIISLVVLLPMLYLKARYAFSYIVAAVEPQFWGFSALGRSAELVKGFYLKLVMFAAVVTLLDLPLMLLKMGISNSLTLLISVGGFKWFLATLFGGVVFVALVVIAQAAIGVFFTVMYFSSRCHHAKSSPFVHETLAAIIHGTDDSGVEFGYKIVGLEPESDPAKEFALDP